ncbi:MAG: VirE protein [Prevotella sp.]|nr:VirE protein [Prevotella sp.]
MSFGIALSVRSRVRECTPALFNQVVDSEQTARVCAEIEDALEKVKRGEMSREDFETFKAEQKKRLAIFTPHAMFPKGRRVNEDAVPSGLSMYDVDHIKPTPNPSPREGSIFQRLVEHTLAKESITDEGMITELKRLGICFAHVTPSTEGFRLFFVMPEGMNLEEAQRWMSEQLGDDHYDGCVKDLARCSFVVPRDYILYLDEEELFSLTPCPSPRGEGSNYSQELSLQNEENRQQDISLPSPVGEGSGVRLFKGIPYSTIISEWFHRTGGEPQTGERNDRLHRLAAHLRYITDNNEALLLQIMPRYGLSEDEMRGLIHSACSARFYSMPKLMQEIISELSPHETSEQPQEKGLGDTPPQMPRKLPPLIRLLLSKTPDIYKPAVAHAVFPALGAHLHKTRFRYIDNVEHEATLMNVLMAETGAGKDCISGPINHIMADIRRRDAENLAREKAWKEEMNSKGANKDKRQRPEGLVIQEIDADMTGPAFVMRMAEADEHFLYTKLNEIDQFDALRGNGRSGQQFQIMCLAFDPNNRYGQTRVGTQSVTEKVCIRFNWNASTTVGKGKRYFQNVLTDGPISRINFCTIPEREIGAEMPVYGTYDAQFDEDLRPYIERLCGARGTIDCPQAYRLAMKLKNECADFARLSQSRTYENLSFRALVIAYLKACVLYVAHDYKWDKTMEDFIRWSLQYDLWCKMRFFGEAIEQSNNSSQLSARRGPRNLLELLPNEFTLEDAVRIRREQGLQRQGAQDMIRMWRNRGYIEERTNEQLNSFVFVKLKFRNE